MPPFNYHGSPFMNAAVQYATGLAAYSSATAGPATNGGNPFRREGGEANGDEGDK